MSSTQISEPRFFAEVCKKVEEALFFYEKQSLYVYVSHLFDQAKKQHQYPVVIENFLQRLEQRGQPNHLGAFIDAAIAQVGPSGDVFQLQTQVREEFEDKFSTSTKPKEQIWYECRSAGSSIEVRQKEAKKEATRLSKERSKWKQEAKELGTAIPNQRASNIRNAVRIPQKDSDDFITEKAQMFGDIYVQTQGLFLFREEDAHYFHASLVIEKATDLVRKSYRGTMSAVAMQQDLKALLTKYIDTLQLFRKTFYPHEVIHLMMVHTDADNDYLDVMNRVAKAYTVEDKRGTALGNTKRRNANKRSGLYIRNAHDDTSGHPMNAALVYETYLKLISKFRDLQNTVLEKNIQQEKSWALTETGTKPELEMPQIPGVLSGIEVLLPEVSDYHKKKARNKQTTNRGAVIDLTLHQGAGQTETSEERQKNSSKGGTSEGPGSPQAPLFDIASIPQPQDLPQVNDPPNKDPVEGTPQPSNHKNAKLLKSLNDLLEEHQIISSVPLNNGPDSTPAMDKNRPQYDSDPKSGVPVDQPSLQPFLEGSSTVPINDNEAERENRTGQAENGTPSCNAGQDGVTGSHDVGKGGAEHGEFVDGSAAKDSALPGAAVSEEEHAIWKSLLNDQRPADRTQCHLDQLPDELLVDYLIPATQPGDNSAEQGDVSVEPGNSGWEAAGPRMPEVREEGEAIGTQGQIDGSRKEEGGTGEASKAHEGEDTASTFLKGSLPYIEQVMSDNAIHSHSPEIYGLVNNQNKSQNQNEANGNQNGEAAVVTGVSGEPGHNTKQTGNDLEGTTGNRSEPPADWVPLPDLYIDPPGELGTDFGDLGDVPGISYEEQLDLGHFENTLDAGYDFDRLE